MNSLVLKIALVVSAAPFLVQAYEYGPDPRYTGAPGDNRTACISAGCHVGTVNSGTGNVKIILPTGTTYTPGQAMAVSVQITDSSKVKFGFEMTARLASDTANEQAGDFTTGTDGFTQVICDDSGVKKNGSLCSPQFPVQFIEHSLAGYKASTRGGYTFTFTWTPPAAGSGNVILYAAANAGPGDPPVSSPTNVYTTSITLSPATPVISPNGVVPIFSTSTTIAPGSWISIYGSNLAGSTTVWNGDFPTSLGGVTVTIDGKSAYLWFVAPSQINVQVPDDAANTGTVNVVVTNGAGNATSTATLSPFGPTFSLLDATHPAGVLLTPDGSGAYGGGTYDLLGPAGAFSFNTRPAKKGEVVELFGTGFGPTSPAVPAGKAFSGPAPVPTLSTNPITVTIDGTSQTLTAYIVGAGLYQINVTVPLNASSGDVSLQATVAGLQTPATVRIPVQ